MNTGMLAGNMLVVNLDSNPVDEAPSNVRPSIVYWNGLCKGLNGVGYQEGLSIVIHVLFHCYVRAIC